MKPIETGCQKSEHGSKDGILLPSDGMFLKEMAGMAGAPGFDHAGTI